MSDFKLPLVRVKTVVEEFNATAEQTGDTISVILPEHKVVSIEDETKGYDSFVDGNGFAFSGVPGLPLPFKVKGNTLEIFECTEAYGLVNKRGRVNLERSLRFFIMEMVENALHTTEEQTELTHPLAINK